ncbi:LysR family transcriptional regulator [Suttonella ornithocola]|uniref:D-malate degradation protein R n=1 Tax=Suttonella ornithocola TaxID=279832 RepID=A0A380MQ39_9GAMM|nr:LysR family transcriptional regulator [Suttonella ornithocola]SUO94013.1 D-malate degradation protein R [Suttonella ornithocola]
MKLTLDALNIFLHIVDKGSIIAAAESLQLPVSAVSRSLAKLEKELDTTLIQRSTRRMALTAEGEWLYQQAQHILNSVHYTEEKLLARHSDVGGLLRINTAAPVMRHVLIPALTEFLSRYPRIEVELNSDDGLIDLLEERTDVAIRIGELQDSTMHARLLGKTAIRVLASPQYLAEYDNIEHIKQLSQYRLLGFTQPAHLNQWPLADSHTGRLLTIKPSISASSGEGRLALAINHMGVVCLSDRMTAQTREKGELIEILPELRQEVQQPIYAVYYRHRSLATRTALLIDYLADYSQITYNPIYPKQI